MKTQRYWIFPCLLLIGALVFIATTSSFGDNTIGASLALLSDKEASSLVGSAFFFQTCGTSKSCVLGGDCGTIQCHQREIEGFPMGCIQTGSGSAGCGDTGNWLNCKWALCVWCSHNGPNRCGTFNSPYCEEAMGGICTGECKIQEGGSCRNDCT